MFAVLTTIVVVLFDLNDLEIPFHSIATFDLVLLNCYLTRMIPNLFGNTVVVVCKGSKTQQNDDNLRDRSFN